MTMDAVDTTAQFYRTVKVDLSGFDVRWAGSYIVFKTVTVSEYPEIQKRVGDAQKKAEESGDYKVLIDAIIEILQEKFVEGVISGVRISPEHLRHLDLEVFMKIMESLIGEKK